MELLDELPEAIQWSEGMLLSPQHMQQNDIYWQRQFSHLFALMQPHGWGLADLAFDESARTGRAFRYASRSAPSWLDASCAVRAIRGKRTRPCPGDGATRRLYRSRPGTRRRNRR